MRRSASLPLALLIASTAAWQSGRAASDSTGHTHRNTLGLAVGHAHLSRGRQSEGARWQALPSWSLTYDRSIGQRWTLGLHGDIIIAEFAVEARSAGAGHDSGEVLRREYPWAAILVGGYRPLHHLRVLLGYGIEVAPAHSFHLIRLGLEPTLPLKDGRTEVLFSLTYDNKLSAYDTWSLGCGIARLF